MERVLIVREVPKVPEEFEFFLKLRPAPVGQVRELVVPEAQIAIFPEWVVDAKIIIRELYNEIMKMAEQPINGSFGQLEIPEGSKAEYFWNLVGAYNELYIFLRDTRQVLMTWYES